MRMVLSMRLFYSIRPYNEIILLDRVVHTIERHRMFTPGDRVAVAVSGGADSVCLLHVLRNLALRWNLTLSVLHINHNLRGAASRADADFVRSLAAALDLPFTLHGLDLATSPGNLEQSARNARLAFFHDRLARGLPLPPSPGTLEQPPRTARLAFFHDRLARGLATRIALGHTRSDQGDAGGESAG